MQGIWITNLQQPFVARRRPLTCRSWAVLAQCDMCCFPCWVGRTPCPCLIPAPVSHVGTSLPFPSLHSSTLTLALDQFFDVNCGSQKRGKGTPRSRRFLIIVCSNSSHGFTRPVTTATFSYLHLQSTSFWALISSI